MSTDRQIDILFKFATRGRSDKFRNQLDKYCDFLSGELNVTFVVSMDLDDRTMNNDDMKWWLSPANGKHYNVAKEKVSIDYYYGNSKTKIQAINADMQNYRNFKILVNLSDDMTVVEKGYDKIIYDDMLKYFPDFNGALHYNDGRAGQRLITLSVMGKPLYDYFGYVYHPSYISVFCDNEFHESVYSLNKAVYIDRVIIKHEWVDYTGKDKLHIRNESFYKKDHANYERRKKINFNPKSN